ncbi:MAG: UDP-N-acetylglucosamine--N-acetylmuramyl-(pentapeptide) pyrophosphoryl-undecaprenol N-acetylglucosamine transferase, partial [Parazoarcus communis]
DRGAAYLLPQAELDAERLAGILASLNRNRLLQMAQNARTLARPDATAEVARICEQLAGGGKA